jgi:hypothetical protein
VASVKLDLQDLDHAAAMALAIHVAEVALAPYTAYWEANGYGQPLAALAAARAVAAAPGPAHLRQAQAAGDAVFDEQPSFGSTAAFEAAEAAGYAALAAAHPKAFKKWTRSAVMGALNAHLVGVDLDENKDFNVAWEQAKADWMADLEQWRTEQAGVGGMAL